MKKVLLAVFLFSLSFAAQAEEICKQNQEREHICSPAGLKEFMVEKRLFSRTATERRSEDGDMRRDRAAISKAEVAALNDCSSSKFQNCVIVSSSGDGCYSISRCYGSAVVVGERVRSTTEIDEMRSKCRALMSEAKDEGWWASFSQ